MTNRGSQRWKSPLTQLFPYTSPNTQNQFPTRSRITAQYREEAGEGKLEYCCRKRYLHHVTCQPKITQKGKKKNSFQLGFSKFHIGVSFFGNSLSAAWP
jgi:hypothetical protein